MCSHQQVLLDMTERFPFPVPGSQKHVAPCSPEAWHAYAECPFDESWLWTCTCHHTTLHGASKHISTPLAPMLSS